MTTYRVVRKRQYTAVASATINDDTLSFRARGVLVWLLDKPDGWQCNSDAIARQGTEGRDAIRTALKELEDSGYLVRHRWRNEGGLYETTTDIHERPRTKEQVAPETGNPALVNRSGFPGAQSLLEVTTKNQPPRVEDESDSFDAFWSVYPRKVGKDAARKMWKKVLKTASPDEVLEGVKRYAAETQGKDVQYLAHPSTWLNDGRWQDEPGANRGRDQKPKSDPNNPQGAQIR